MGPKLLFSISKAKDLEIVLNSPSALGKSVFYKPLELIGGQGLFSAPIPRWKRNRKIIMPTLNRKILETFVPVFAKQSDVLLERLVKEAGKGEFNIFDYVVNCITDNLCETVMGVEVNVQGGDSDFAKWTCTGLYIAYVRISRIWYHSDFIFKLSPYSEKFDDVIGKMNGFVNDVIQKKREEYKAQCRSGTAFVDEGFPNFSGTTKKSFLDLLIELSETGTLFTDDELREEVMNFMVAGSDTSSSMISYLFMVLGMYPEIQQKLYEEVIEVLGPNRPVEYSDLKKFVYLNRVLRETLRLFPPAPFVARAITDDIKLGIPEYMTNEAVINLYRYLLIDSRKTIVNLFADECTLPAGSSALINIMGLHRDPSVYPEPSKFDPDRFLKDEVAKRHPYSWLPFSGGPLNTINEVRMKKDLVENDVLLQNVTNALWLLLFGSCISWYLRYHWKKRNLYLAAWKRPGPFSLPLLGHAFFLLGSPKSILQNMLKLNRQYKSPVPVWIGPKLLFSITEAKDLEIVLNNPNALEKNESYEFLKIAVGEGLFSAPVARWKHNRKIIMPTLNQKILDSFVPFFADQSNILLKELETKVGTGDFNIFEYIMKCIIDNLCETVMGVSINVQGSDSDFVKWVSIAMDISYMRISKVWYHSDFIFRLSSHSRKIDDVISKMNSFVDDVIVKKREEYRVQCRSEPSFVDEELSKRKSFLDLLIELSENGTEFRNQELRDEVMTFIVAGSDTNASIISYLFMVLGMYPEVQQKLYEEIIDVLGPSRPVEHTDLKNFEYMTRILKETFRLFPPAPFIARALTEDIKLDECTLPAGSSALINIIAMHRDPSVYPEPLKFDPDRFLKEEVAKRHPYSWLPFSGGPRNCIGSNYAYMSIKAVIASVVRKFKFSSKYKKIEDIDLKAELMLKPVDGYNVSIEYRE
ncbi:hypothetical protein FQR65_LT11319 [Abscondita terminalis]|nr:hypothetical protein FQR65_LT11319 [Abscondita terminalis]